MIGHNRRFWIPHIVILMVHFCGHCTLLWFFEALCKCAKFLIPHYLFSQKEKINPEYCAIWILFDHGKIPQPDQHYYPFTRGLRFIFEYIFLLKAGDRAGYGLDLKESSSEVSRENEAHSNMALVVKWEK